VFTGSQPDRAGFQQTQSAPAKGRRAHRSETLAQNSRAPANYKRRGMPQLFPPCRLRFNVSGIRSRFAVNYLVDRTAKLAGFDNLHPHCLRHSCGYALADKGIDLRTIQEWLGHRSIEMTVRYTRISQRGLWR